MQLVCISRGEQERGKLFAQTLAQKLAFECLGQEELSDRSRGILPSGVSKASTPTAGSAPPQKLMWCEGPSRITLRIPSAGSIAKANAAVGPEKT